MKKFLIHGFIASVLLLCTLELFFRTVLPAAEWPRGIIFDSGIRRFDSESFTSGRYSYGRYCRGRYFWSINSQGWNSIFDYKTIEERQQPMVAILGDSYLEGFYSDVNRHIDKYLTDIFEDSMCFYTFAMSGGILSQYIALMKYEIEQYSPDAYIVFINSSDINKSIRELGGMHPYYFQYSQSLYGDYFELKPNADSRSAFKDILLRSAFIRYLRSNAQVSIFGGGLADENANKESLNLHLDNTGNHSELNAAAIFLLGELDSFDKPVMVVADCPMNWIYDGSKRVDYDDVVALRENIDHYDGVSLIELADYYPEEYSREGRIFGHSDNPHWSAYSNEFIANVLAPHVKRLLMETEGMESDAI